MNIVTQPTTPSQMYVLSMSVKDDSVSLPGNDLHAEVAKSIDIVDRDVNLEQVDIITLKEPQRTSTPNFDENNPANFNDTIIDGHNINKDSAMTERQQTFQNGKASETNDDQNKMLATETSTAVPDADDFVPSSIAHEKIEKSDECSSVPTLPQMQEKITPQDKCISTPPQELEDKKMM